MRSEVIPVESSLASPKPEERAELPIAMANNKELQPPTPLSLSSGRDDTVKVLKAPLPELQSYLSKSYRV